MRTRPSLMETTRAKFCCGEIAALRMANPTCKGSRTSAAPGIPRIGRIAPAAESKTKLIPGTAMPASWAAAAAGSHKAKEKIRSLNLMLLSWWTNDARARRNADRSHCWRWCRGVGRGALARSRYRATGRGPAHNRQDRDPLATSPSTNLGARRRYGKLSNDRPGGQTTIGSIDIDRHLSRKAVHL